ncbi:SDR family NAD(P)-dependent oxidoreductase [Nonomuraea sp. NPDC050556]|uniref:SDR family NAD(P)-dependent oxidoreductase n=1 Tax=Nonomuraea sp. NPDC050556 TaxID=3364369 RepID=UPI0037BA87C8
MRPRRTALVTGGSRGIGLEIARRLAEEGYDLTLTARESDALRKEAVRLSALGARVEAEPGDMAAEEDVRRIAAMHTARFGRLDALVISAGVGSAGRLAEYPIQRFDKQVSVNVRSPFLLIGELLHLLRATAELEPATGTKIIAVSSLAAFAPEPGLAAYAATKAALVALCAAVNTEESSAGVSATAICPGYVDTDMSAWIHDRIPAEEMISAADVAELALAITRLSRRAVVPHLPVLRPGAELWRG